MEISIDRPYGVFVNGLLMNRFQTRGGASKLISHFGSKGVMAIMREVCECGQIQNSLCKGEGC